MILTIARVLVDEPDQVKPQPDRGAQVICPEVVSFPKRYGKIIGKQGRNADAVRTVSAAVAAKSKKKIVLEIIN